MEFQNGDIVRARFQKMAGKEQRASAAAIPEAAEVVAVDPDDAEREIPHVEECVRQFGLACRRRGHIEGGVIESWSGVWGLRRRDVLNACERQRDDLPIGQFGAIEEGATDQAFAARGPANWRW